jgi:catalase
MRFNDNSKRAKNYEPNSFGGPQQSNEPVYGPIEVQGLTGSTAGELHPEDNDYVQAGNLYRVMNEDAKKRLIENIAGSLSRVSRNEIIERSIGHFRKADLEYGRRVAEAVAALRKSSVA